MNIYKVLSDDHEKLRMLLAELVELNDKATERRSELISEIRDELIPHARAEEAVFYNSLRMIEPTKSMGMHGYAEHLEAEGLFRALQAMDKLDTSWKATAQKLKQTIEHHIREEENEMFSAAKQLFTEEEAVAMAETFEAMKPKIKEEGLMKTTLDMVANLMPPRFSDKFRSFNLNQH